MSARDLAPVILFLVLLSYEWALWRLAPRAAARGMRNMVTVYLARVAIVAVYAAVVGVDLGRYLTEGAAGGIVLGAAIVLAFALASRRRWDRIADAVRNRPRDVAVWAAYVIFAVALVEEVIFRGALLL